MSADDHLNSQQFPRRMRPSELLPYADQSKLKDTQGNTRSYITDLGNQIKDKGYKTSKHGGMSGDTHSYPLSSPITVLHGPGEDTSLWEGNHRVLGMNAVGYDDPVPVLHKFTE
jgi:hypothetical protein